ncbi:MAG: cytochrome d ubiquinol oxidase subunit II [Saprospiraceae bacterium]|nr:cytochrome d ubiquinol oxidase subunit II [Saprospiraceae bacterium]
MLLFIIIFVLCVSFFLYTILGGADFGAGILELVGGNKAIKPVYKAIAPVWEANHVWLILAVVLIFTNFPEVYAEISTSLHIPLYIVLLGIIVRGTAFTFRHYDAYEDSTHKLYHWAFRLSSLLTPVFLGIVLGAMILGKITNDPSSDFLERYIHPWFNPFCLVFGMFVASLFAYISTAYFLGEEQTKEDYTFFSLWLKRFAILSVLLGGTVLFLGYIYGAPFIDAFLVAWYAWIGLGITTVLLWVIWRQLANKKLIRFLVSAQVAVVMMTWLSIQAPVIVYMSSGSHLTVDNTMAATGTQYYTVIALVVGLLIIFPSLYYLFRIFKFSSGEK